jgi:hypothetical protein
MANPRRADFCPQHLGMVGLTRLLGALAVTNTAMIDDGAMDVSSSGRPWFTGRQLRPKLRGFSVMKSKKITSKSTPESEVNVG